MHRSSIQRVPSHALMLALLLAWTAPRAGPAKPLVVVLNSHDGRPYQAMLAGFKGYLSEQGEAVRYRILSLEGAADPGARIAQALDGEAPALVYALGGLATRVATRAFPQGPIVSGMVLDSQTLEGADHVTGVALEFPIETQFQWLVRLLPDYRSVGVLYNPEQNGAKIRAAQALARKRGLRLQAIAVDSPKELPAALDTLVRRVDVLWGIPDRVVFSTATAKAILLATFRNRIPFIGLSNAWVKAGALYALEWDYGDMGRQTGEMAAKLLQGVSIRDLPSARPREVGYTLNLKTAGHLKIDWSEGLIDGARQVYR